MRKLITSFWKESSTTNFGDYLIVQCDIYVKILWLFKKRYSCHVIEVLPKNGIVIMKYDYGSYNQTGFFGKTIHIYKR
jgi:hypothetical protein